MLIVLGDLARRASWRNGPAATANDTRLVGISYSSLSRQTGLSRRYCKLIAIGDAVPHPVYWEAFRSLTAPIPSPTTPRSTNPAERRTGRDEARRDGRRVSRRRSARFQARLIACT